MAVALSSSSQRLMQEISDQFLICKICFETYTKPKTLTCLHIFCMVCLEKHMDAEVERSYRYMLYTRSITCPVCRKKTELPSGGIRRLPDNFLIANLIEIVSRRRGSTKVPQCEICKSMPYQSGKDAGTKCLECGKLMCRNCVELHRRTKVTRGHNLIDIQVEKSIGCKVHEEEVVRFYCEPCEMCICVLCTFQEHKGHNIQSFSEGMQKYHSALNSLVLACRDRIICIKNHLEMIKTCEEEMHIAEDQIRDSTIEAIATIRASEKQQVKELYDVFGDDTIQFLKEKHALQDVLENLTSNCSLTEMILKDKSIELLLLRHELQDKLEVLLQGRVQPPPVNLLKAVKFDPGHITLGQILIDGKPSKEGMNEVVLYNRCRGYDKGVQTRYEDWDEGGGSLQTDDDKLSRQPQLDRRDRSVNTCSPDRQTSTTMTDSVSSLTDNSVESWNQCTNTPTVQLVHRSTLTTQTNVSNSQTETKGLIEFCSTIAGPDLPSMHSVGMTTDLPHVRCKGTITTAARLADKKTTTHRTITHDIACDPVKINTHDFGVMTKLVPGVEKGIGTKTIVHTDAGTGSGLARLARSADVGTDTIWKGVRRVCHKATMHEMLYSTRETDTDELVVTEERASSPCEELAVMAPKRKYSPTASVGETKRACTLRSSEVQTDLHLQMLDQILTSPNRGALEKHSPMAKTPGWPESQLGELVAVGDNEEHAAARAASRVRVTDIGTGLVHVHMLERSGNAKVSQFREICQADVPDAQLEDTSSETAERKMFEHKGITTVTLRTADKETATASIKMKEKGTETYVPSVEKATYMIQPVILSTGTNTPVRSTSEKESGTDFDTFRDDWNSGGAQSVGSRVNTATAAATVTDDSERTASIDGDFYRRPVRTGSMDPDMAGRTRLTGERGMTGGQLKDPGTPMLAVDSPDKTAVYDHVQTSNQGTMTLLLMSDIMVNKRPHELTRLLSMKKIKTVAMDTAQAGGDTASEVVDHAIDSPMVCRPEKNTATFKVEFKSTGVGTPLIKFHDRDSSPIRIGMFERSTSMSGIEFSPNQEWVQLPTAAMRRPGQHPQGVSSVSKGNPIARVTMVERGSSPVPPNTTECGTGTAHIVFYEKETCTPKIMMMNKNMETENIHTADKQTATINIANVYKDLITPKNGSVITVSRGTCTPPAPVVNRETSPIRDRPFQVETGTNPIRKIYINKAVGVTKADLMCPVDTFQRVGQGRPRILPKNMPVEEPDPKFDPMATIHESDEDDEGSRSGNSSPGCGLRNRMRLSDTKSNAEMKANTHQEKLWVTAPRLGTGNGDHNGVGVGSMGGASSAAGGSGGKAGWQSSLRNQGGQSTFSANGSTQTSSIVCKVETGTSTPPVEMEDKAMCTESISVDGKITECISKLRVVSQRLEAQTTSLIIVDDSTSAGPIYSKANSCRRESLTTQAMASPILSGRVTLGSSEEGPEHCVGLAPLQATTRRPLRRTGSRLGEAPEMMYPPFLARRELHSIDTGMVGSSPAAGGGEAPSSMTGTDIGGGSSRSKARKQRLDITQLLHRPLGATTLADGVIPHLTQRAPYRPSFGHRPSLIDESSRQQQQSDVAIKRLQAKMRAMEYPEEEHAQSPVTSAASRKTKDPVDSESLTLLKQRSERLRLERMLGSLSSSSSSSSSSTTSCPSPAASPKVIHRQRAPKIQQKPSPPVARRNPRSSKSCSPPVKHDKGSERRESASSEHGKGVCCGLAGSSSPRGINGSGVPSPRIVKKGLNDIGRLRKVHSGSPCSSSSTSEDGRDSPGDRVNRRNRKEP